jgi:hypothetical protein
VAVDSAGKGFVGRRADHSRPTIRISSPLPGARYRRDGKVSAHYRCFDADGPLDVKSCWGTVPAGHQIDTATLGRHSFTVHGTDWSGNKRTRIVHYLVVKPQRRG